MSFKNGRSREGSNLVSWKFDQELNRMGATELIIWHELPFNLV